MTKLFNTYIYNIQGQDRNHQREKNLKNNIKCHYINKAIDYRFFFNLKNVYHQLRPNVIRCGLVHWAAIFFSAW